MYNFIKYSDNYSKASWSLWQYCNDGSNDNITQSESFKSKIKITGKTPAVGNTKDVKTWSSDCVISSATGETKLKITDAKLYVSVVTLSTQDNAKLLQQLKSGFKKTINLNKYQSNPKAYAQNIYLNHLVDPSSQGVNRLFVLSFENEDDRTSHSTYYLINVMIDCKNVFD